MFFLSFDSDISYCRTVTMGAFTGICHDVIRVPFLNDAASKYHMQDAWRQTAYAVWDSR